MRNQKNSLFSSSLSHSNTFLNSSLQWYLSHLWNCKGASYTEIPLAVQALVVLKSDGGRMTKTWKKKMERYGVSACILNRDCFGEHHYFLKWSFNIYVFSFSLLIMIHLGYNGGFPPILAILLPCTVRFLITGMLGEVDAQVIEWHRGIALLFRVGFGHDIVQWGVTCWEQAAAWTLRGVGHSWAGVAQHGKQASELSLHCV